MQVKRYVAADMRRALELVRNDLGADAIILSNRRVKQGVEILTTIDGGFEKKDDPEREKESDKSWDDGMLSHSDAVMTVAKKPPQRIEPFISDRQIKDPLLDDPLAKGFLPNSSAAKDDSAQQRRSVARDANNIPKVSLTSGNLPKHLQAEIAAAREKMFAAQWGDGYANNDAQASGLLNKHRDLEARVNEKIQQNKPVSAAEKYERPVERRNTQRDDRVAEQTNSRPSSSGSSHAEAAAMPQIGSALMDLIRQDEQRPTHETRDYETRAQETAAQETIAPKTITETATLTAAAKQSNASHKAASVASSANVENQRELADVKTELRSMRSLIQDQIGSMAWGQFSSQNPVQAALWVRFHNMGLSSELIKELTSRVPEKENLQDAWRKSLATLAKKLGVFNDDIMQNGGGFALVGPTGVGKTTTIGKLAARHVLKHGSDSVALVTTDNYRIAAHEQLRAFSKILDIPIKVAHKPGQLAQILDELASKSLILIDTAGLSSQDPQLSEQLQTLHSLQGRIKTLMVLASTAQKQVMKAAIKSYQPAGLHGCVLTKLDEVMSLGESFSAVIECDLPLAYFTDGQTIPDDLHMVKPKKLVNKAISLSRQYTAEPDNVVGSFQSVMNKLNKAERALLS